MITADDRVRLIDFGLAAESKRRDLTEIAGTPYYMAPEVIQSTYGKQSDLWSLGVVLYTLVSGYLPFQGENPQAVQRKIVNSKHHYNHAEFDLVSDECKDLIEKLLTKDPSKRISG